jgi:hypothetical protein
VAGHEVGLAVEVRHPEAVDDVRRGELEEHGAAHGEVYLVGRRQHVRRGRVLGLHLPPPLVADDLHRQMLLRRDRVERAPRQEAVDEKDEQNEDRQRHPDEDDV